MLPAGCIVIHFGARAHFIALKNTIMILDWFDAREAVAFAHEISCDIESLFPVSPTGRKKATSTKKDHKKLDRVVLRTRVFAQQHRLNIYKKGKLLNAIKWHMREQGQDETLVNEIIRLLAPLLNG